MRKFIALSIVTIGLGSCATILSSKHQNLLINTGNPKSTVTVNEEKVGTGNEVDYNLTRDFTGKQIKVETPECKTTYYAVLPNKTNPLACVSCFFGYVPAPFDYANSKTYMYPKTVDALAGKKKKVKTKDDKYIDINDVRFDIKEKDFKFIPISYNNYANKIDEAESNNKKNKYTPTGKNDIKVDNTIFSGQLSKVLKKYGYIDTVNQIFKDQANSIELRANVKTLTFFSVFYYPTIVLGTGMSSNPTFYICKSDISWDVMNSYGEVLKSVTIRSQSGEFVSSEKLEDMIGDMIEGSLDQVLANNSVAPLTKVSAKAESTIAASTLTKPTAYVTGANDVQPATVIVKTEKGHGSGFAITNDGYIITNYHVIASENADKPQEATIILNDGSKQKATLVKANKDRDVALLKIETKFDKCFEIPMQKNFAPLEEVFAMGAPKSIELGQSASKGIISSERNVNNISLIQTNISINGGNSGGPMFNKDGKLYGIVTSKLFGIGVEGVAFAVPAYKLKEYLNIDFK